MMKQTLFKRQQTSIHPQPWKSDQLFTPKRFNRFIFPCSTYDGNSRSIVLVPTVRIHGATLFAVLGKKLFPADVHTTIPFSKA